MDLDKLSCKETMDLSDLENSANDDIKDSDDKPTKRKRRRREIEMIKLSDEDDSDDESITKKILRNLSPESSHREPRTCVLKASQKRRPLTRLLEQLHRNLEKKDPNNFFAWPVNDNFAPNYSKVIKKPMDFNSMKQKIEDNVYKSLNCFISDFKLMCNNAMKYNKPGTVYHKAAKRLLHIGLKQLTPQKLRPLGDILTYMYEIPIRELGFDMGKMDMHKVLKSHSPIKSGGSETDNVSDGGQDRQDSGDSVKLKMEAAREKHRKNLAKKAFPRMESDGTTTLPLVFATANGSGPTIGQLVGKLKHGTATLHIPREDRRNLAKCVRPLEYAPFGSHAPAHDGTFATLTKEQSHLILHTLPSETGRLNPGNLRFAPDSPWNAIYDMDAMFPEKKPDPSSADDVDVSKIKIDVEELKSLASLGIDVEFVSELEDEIRAATHDYGIAGALSHTHQLLLKLQREQHDRLSNGGAGGGARASEKEAARLAAACLRAMAARVPPRQLLPQDAARRAMAVTLAHLDTPLAVDDFEMEQQDLKDGLSDFDSRSSQDK